mgnify:CR=1 FL=1
MADIEKLLHYALENGIINLSEVTRQVKMDKKVKAYREQITVWQAKNGRWNAYLPDGNGRKLVSRKNRSDLEAVIQDFCRELSNNPTIGELFEEWIERKIKYKEICDATVTRYRNDFKSYFSEFGKNRIKDVTEMDIEDFVKGTVVERELTRKAFNNLRTIFYGIYRIAKKKGLTTILIRDTFADMEISRKAFKPKNRETAKNIYFAEEEQKVIDYLTANQDIVNLGLLLIFYSGLRIGELVALKPPDLQGNKIFVYKTETRYMKDDKFHAEVKYNPKTEAGIRTVIIPDSAIWIVKKLHVLNPFGEWLFMHDGRRYTADIFRKRISAVCKECGIDPKSPHKIRKTYGTKLYDSEMPRSVICQLMGHTDIACLEQYYYFDRSDDEKKAKYINSVSGF